MKTWIRGALAIGLAAGGGPQALAADGDGVELVSLTSEGKPVDGGGGWMSADGRFVVFVSDTDNIVPGDTNGWEDVFVRDRLRGTTERVSVSSSGVGGDGASFIAAISTDGRFVVFGSYSTNLVPGDTNHQADVFVRDLQRGTTERVSVGGHGQEANGGSSPYALAISANGRFVAFVSKASNLVGHDNNGAADTFVRDRKLGTTERVSVGQGGVEGDKDSLWYESVAISAGGRFVALALDATNLVPGDGNGASDVCVHDREKRSTERVSIATNSTRADKGSSEPSISADGRFVAFTSDADNLVPGDTNRYSDVFVRNRQLGTTELVSLRHDGSLSANPSDAPSISADGSLVAFQRYYPHVHYHGDVDVFVRDRRADRTEVIVSAPGGCRVGCPVSLGALSANGRFVTLYSEYFPQGVEGVYLYDRQHH